MNTLVSSPVVLVRWPDDADALERLRALNVPRLLLVAETAEPPTDADPLQDWIRLPASDPDLQVRIRGLELRATDAGRAPELPGDGRLLYKGEWVVVSPTSERMLRALVDNFGDVVSGTELHRAGWPDGDGTPGALRIHVLRIRQALEPVGLELKVVRDRGYVLQARPPQAQ